MTAFFLDLDESNFTAASRDLARFRPTSYNMQGFIWQRAALEGWIARYEQNGAAATAAFLTARQTAAQALAQRPDDPRALVVLARIDAGLGR